jgi:hypothetical protein
MFLRGLPQLCKSMKRPGVAKKLAADPDLEPDLDKISEMFPTPTESRDKSILLPSTINGGPRARMPVESASKFQPVETFVMPSAANMLSSSLQPYDNPNGLQWNAGDFDALRLLQEALGACDNPFGLETYQSQQVQQSVAMPDAGFSYNFNYQMKIGSSLADADQLAFSTPSDPNGASTDQSGSSDSRQAEPVVVVLVSSQYNAATGFESSCEDLDQQRFNNMLESLSTSLPAPDMPHERVLEQLQPAPLVFPNEDMGF